jgi:glutamate 5-kinase
LTIPQKQAAAAVGQSRLNQKYQDSFSKKGITTAQILLTHNDLSDRSRYLNARHTVMTLLQNGVIPIINENDTVIVEEIKFGDNDTLGALITSLAEADLYILLTDTDGLFDRNPHENPNAQLIPLVSTIDATIEKAARDTSSKTAVGGMITKIEAAKRATSYGVPTLIANGHKTDTLPKIFSGEMIGTLFTPQKSRLASRKHWIAHTLRPKGVLTVDAGAAKALGQSGKSLLPSGITSVQGKFEMGEPVQIKNENKEVFAQGLVNYNSLEIGKIMGKKSSEIEKILGYNSYDEIIHRDDLVLMKESS